VVHVSARDAEAFCAWSGTRLPSEQEWEHAARGGLDGAIFPWGDDPPEGRCRIFTGVFPHAPEPGRLGTLPARSLAPNGYGLYHAVGNVWEWTADAWSVPGEEPTPGQRVRRGGSYLCHDSYCNRYRVAARDHSGRNDTTGNIGFRVALGPPEQVTGSTHH
jgi:formylglycine-generating enzyme required for sulfatase activity